VTRKPHTLTHPPPPLQDEPSTGLDPASRRTLWGCIREAKRTRAILLTTHSMEEAGRWRPPLSPPHRLPPYGTTPGHHETPYEKPHGLGKV
jgi:hypothetical protein